MAQGQPFLSPPSPSDHLETFPCCGPKTPEACGRNFGRKFVGQSAQHMKHENAQKTSPNSSPRLPPERRNFALGKVRRNPWGNHSAHHLAIVWLSFGCFPVRAGKTQRTSDCQKSTVYLTHPLLPADYATPSHLLGHPPLLSTSIKAGLCPLPPTTALLCRLS